MMRKLTLALAILAVVAVPAQASEHGFRGGHEQFKHFNRFQHGFRGPHVFVGPRVFIGPGPFWYPYPYAYYPSPVVIEPAPQVYVQPPPAPPPQSYWYYCEDPKGYYPYVSQCPGGWMQVVPRTNAPTP